MAQARDEMDSARKITAGQLKVLSPELDDHQITEILKLDATTRDLEKALAWDASDSDFSIRQKEPLAGKAEKIFLILNWNRPAREEERRD